MAGSKSPADSPDSSTPASPSDSDSSSPPTKKSSPPPPKKSSPPPEDSSPPPSSPPPKSPPPPKKSPPASPPKKSPPPPSPPKQSSPPPTSPKQSPPPQESKTPSPPPKSASSPPPESSADQSPPAPTGKTPAAPKGDRSSPSDKTPFVSPPPSLPSKPSDSSSSPVSSGSSSKAVPIAAGVIGGMLLAAIVACLWMFCRRRKRRKEYQIWHNGYPNNKPYAVNIPPGAAAPPAKFPGAWGPPPPVNHTSSTNNSGGAYSYGLSPYHNPTPLPPPSPPVGLVASQNCFSYEDLVAATDGFSTANVLGQGGFGPVHKGILPGGKEVAVKSLKAGSGQGEREFRSEVEIISRVHHRHLVSLVGYCIAGDKRLLVYEFVPNNNLEYHLHKSEDLLDFKTRVRIALGSAKGIAYLHEDCHPRIIHRDIKASNILLDYHFEAQVADFGLAKLTSDANTHISTRVMGTFGYLAPEYAASGKLTEKSDVFSYGVMLLELITGRRPVDPNNNYMEDSLVDWARPLLSKAQTDGVYDELVDPKLVGNFNARDMASMVACAAVCIRHSAKRRPRMKQIVRALEGDMSLDNLQDGGTKTSSSGSSTPARDSPDHYDTETYHADLRRFRQMAFGTQEFGGESTGNTSEYSLDPSSSTSSNDNSPRESGNAPRAP